jgi:uncharacterized SAM-binding protein YcdF (DUF218 family)
MASVKAKKTSSIKKLLAKTAWRVAKFFGFLIFVNYILWPMFILPNFAKPLFRHDRPAASTNAVISLMGEPFYRPKAAAEVINKGLGKHLIMVECEPTKYELEGFVPSESEIAKSEAIKAGLVDNQIFVLKEYGRITSTVEEAVALKKHFVRNPPEHSRIIVVTSWYHTSRAGWIFDKVFDETGITIEMIPVEKTPFSIENWWQSEAGMITVFEEYLKWLRYLYKYAGRTVNLNP